MEMWYVNIFEILSRSMEEPILELPALGKFIASILDCRESSNAKDATGSFVQKGRTRFRRAICQYNARVRSQLQAKLPQPSGDALIMALAQAAAQ